MNAVVSDPLSKLRPFATDEEVDAYLSGDSLECLICGERVRRLAPHFQHRHPSVSMATYREALGIPASRRLYKRPTDAEIAAAIERLIAGETIAIISKEMGMTRETLYYAIKIRPHLARRWAASKQKK